MVIFNRFEAFQSICRKIELAQNIGKIGNIRPEICDFHPKKFVLPDQFQSPHNFSI
jgi:hypothetical protein